MSVIVSFCVMNSVTNTTRGVMTVKVEKLERVFLFNGVKLPDPSPNFTVEQVRDTYVNTYPELATAAIEGPSPIDGTMQHTFTRAVGAKG
jgi:PRTRC genetic system protein C